MFGIFAMVYLWLGTHIGETQSNQFTAGGCVYKTTFGACFESTTHSCCRERYLSIFHQKRSRDWGEMSEEELVDLYSVRLAIAHNTRLPYESRFYNQP